MKPRKPKIVRVMGCEYSIIFKPLNGLFGETDLTLRKIFINSENSDAVQKETLLHELYHCCMEECPGLSNGKFTDREEAIIRYVSPRMFQLIRDNPKVKHYIFD